MTDNFSFCYYLTYFLFPPSLSQDEFTETILETIAEARLYGVDPEFIGKVQRVYDNAGEWLFVADYIVFYYVLRFGFDISVTNVTFFVDQLSGTNMICFVFFTLITYPSHPQLIITFSHSRSPSQNPQQASLCRRVAGSLFD